MPADPNSLARIAAARAFLGGSGPVFLTPDGRRISAIRSPSASVGGSVVEILFRDGFGTGDDQIISAIIDLMWLPAPKNCGVRTLSVENGELV